MPSSCPWVQALQVEQVPLPVQDVSPAVHQLLLGCQTPVHWRRQWSTSLSASDAPAGCTHSRVCHLLLAQKTNKCSHLLLAKNSAKLHPLPAPTGCSVCCTGTSSPTLWHGNRASKNKYRHRNKLISLIVKNTQEINHQGQCLKE